MENRDDCWWSGPRSTSSSSSAENTCVGRSGKQVMVNLSGLVMIINKQKWKTDMMTAGWREARTTSSSSSARIHVCEGELSHGEFIWLGCDNQQQKWKTDTMTAGWSGPRSTSSSSSAKNTRVGRSGKQVVVNLSGLVVIIINNKNGK